MAENDFDKATSLLSKLDSDSENAEQQYLTISRNDIKDSRLGALVKKNKNHSHAGLLRLYFSSPIHFPNLL